MSKIFDFRSDFPILNQQINGCPLVYFDNAATSQKPQQVIDSIVHYYKNTNANIHRGVHKLSGLATDAFEEARKKIQSHFNAKKSHEIIFTSGTTHGINLVTTAFENLIQQNDEVLVSEVEHHSNIVPIQMLCKKTGATLKVIPMNPKGELQMELLPKLLTPKVKLVFVNHVSNSLGTINPIQEIVKQAHAVGAAVMVDGAQSCAHLKPDLQKLDVDFYVASAHKMCGPTGIGVLYGKEAWLTKLPPYQGGGEMIEKVTFKETTYADLPHKFEAGTPNIAGAIGFGAAIDYLNEIGFQNIEAYEKELLDYATRKLEAIDGLKVYGTSKDKVSLVSFNIDTIHPYDIGSILDQMGIAVRTGHHCTQPVMDYFKIPGTVRASFSFYNTFKEIDVLVSGLQKAKEMFQ